jgi:hypothetical protein
MWRLSSEILRELFAMYIFLATARVIKPSGSGKKDGGLVGGLVGLADAILEVGWIFALPFLFPSNPSFCPLFWGKIIFAIF